MKKKQEQPITDQERYDLLGEVLHQFKLDLVKSSVNLEAMKKSVASQTLLGRINPQAQAMNQQGMAILSMQLESLPKMIVEAKEMRFELYEKLKKDGAAPTK